MWQEVSFLFRARDEDTTEVLAFKDQSRHLQLELIPGLPHLIDAFGELQHSASTEQQSISGTPSEISLAEQCYSKAIADEVAFRAPGCYISA